MCKQQNQSGADNKQKCRNCERKVQYGVIHDKKNLNIEHSHINIRGCENHDKEKNTMAWIPVWVFRSTSGLSE